MPTLTLDRPTAPPPTGARPWLCPDCGSRLGLLVYARRKPIELHPTAPLIRVNGDVLWFRCQGCEAPVRWVVRPSVQDAA